MHPGQKRFVVILFALSLAVASAPRVAHAISQEEIITLTKLGISPDEIIKAIEKDRTVFQLQVEDILKLKSANVAEDVLKFMLSTPRRYGTEEGGKPKTGTPEESPTQPVVEQPVEETPEEKAAREEQMRIEAERLAAEEARIREQQRKAYAKGVLAKGRSLADRGKFVESIQTFQGFVEQGNFPPDSEEAYLARFGIANALVKAGLYQAAARELLDVVLEGPDRPFFEAAFKQLRSLRRRINYSPPDLERLTGFFVDNFSQAFRDSYDYVLGEFYYDYGNWTPALQYLDRVTPRARDYAKAQYLKGLIEARENLVKSAVESFQNAIVATEENNSDAEVIDLSYLALARIAYEFANDYDAAIYYYRKVPKGSYKTVTALYESAWVFFVKGDYSRALGTFQILHSPYFNHMLYPELWILEATIYMNLCHFDFANEALDQWNAEIAPLAYPLKQFLLKTVRPEEYYAAIVSTVAGKRSYNLPKRLTAPVLADVEFYNLYKTIKQIEHEQDVVARQVDRLGPFGVEISEKLRSLRGARIRDVGLRIRQVLKETENALAEYGLKLKEIEVDLRDQELKEKERELLKLGGTEVPEPEVGGGVETGGAVAIVGSDSWEWPFEGEYWSDEIGAHRAFIKDQCPVESDAAPLF